MRQRPRQVFHRGEDRAVRGDELAANDAIVTVRAESHDATGGLRRMPHHDGVIGVDDHDVRRRLVHPDARLGIGVVLDGGVPVEVVVAEVQPHRHDRAELIGHRQLRGRHLGHDDVDVLLDRVDQWEPDVAAGDGALA